MIFKFRPRVDNKGNKIDPLNVGFRFKPKLRIGHKMPLQNNTRMKYAVQRMLHDEYH